MAEQTLLYTLAERFRPYHDDLIAFAQKLVQTPSLPGQEGDVAALIQAEMARLRYDDVWVDRVGNVIGCIRGRTSAQPVMLNAHMDHVTVGDDKAWAYHPFSAEIVNGEMWGRGTVDDKGSLACMVYAGGALRREIGTPPQDVYVMGVVFEEQGGLGTEVVLERVRPEFCIIGEATRNQLSLGHRGVVGLVVEITGRMAHASMVHRAINPHYSAARFILGLRNLTYLSDPMLGSSTAAPTLYIADQTSGNVIPGRIQLYVDWRSVPGETPESVMEQVRNLLKVSLEPGTSGSVREREFRNRTYTGLDFTTMVGKIAVKTDPQSELAVRSHRALEMALGRSVERIVWRFCSDGAVCAQAGVPMVGFGPGDPELAHTSEERVPLSELKEAIVGNAALALSSILPPAMS